MKRRSIGLAIAAALALVATPDSWAAHRGGRGSGHHSGFGAARFSSAGVPAPRIGLGIRPLPMAMPATGATPPHPHHHPGRTVIFIGAPFMYWAWPYGYAYLPPPYYYGPDYGVPKEEMPAIYVEKFDGEPTPQTTGDVFCPGKYAYYPDVRECPGGWQRLIRESDGPADSG
jgi:hypothetical protein